MTNISGSNRFINWLFFNVILGCIPLVFVFVFRSFASKSLTDSANDFPEALFFSLMICATTINDLRMSNKSDNFYTRSQILELLLFLGVIGIAIIYGVLKFRHIQDPALAVTTTQFYAILIATILFIIIGIVAQVFINLVGETANPATEQPSE